MKSPFPGTDPYLESRWSDIHTTLITMIKESIQPQLPPELRARSEERILIEGSEEEESLANDRSDVALVDVGQGRRAGAERDSGAVATVDPVLVTYHVGPVFERFIQIIDRTSGNRVVTAIEVLSP